MNPDVAIVGGGAIGAACALELARRGARVALLERGPELAWGCSSGNAGLLCPSHSTPIANPEALRLGLASLLRKDGPFALRARPQLAPWLVRYLVAATAPERAARAADYVRALSTESLGLHAALAEEGLPTGFRRSGILSVYETAAGLAAGAREAIRQQAGGTRVEVLDARGARELEPALTGGIAGALLHPDEAQCDPAGFVHAVGAAAARAGAEIRLRTEVLGLRRDAGGLVVDTTAESLRPGTLVLAAGVWSARLARQLGLYVPVEGGKGYHVDLEPGDGDPGLPVMAVEARAIATPLGGVLRLSGTLELAGLDESVSRRRVDAVTASLRRVLHIPERPVRDVWRGLRPCTPDGLPIVGRAPEAADVVLATGHAMKGLSLAPVTGRIVADIVVDGETGADVAPLDPARFRTFLGL